MRRTYSKAGLSVLVLYGAMSVVSGVILGIAAGIAVAFMGLKGFSIPSDLDLSSISQMMDYFQSEEILVFLIPGIVLGSVGGMSVGILIMKKILPAKNNIPIPKRKLSAKECLLIAGMAFGLWGVGAFIGNLPEWFGIGIGDSFLNTTHPIIIVYYLYAVFGAPFFEELAFRKVLLDAAHPYGEVQAAFLSALLFGIMHGNAAQFMLAFTLGLLLASVYQRTGRVIYTMALHFMINLTATIPSLFALGNINIDLIWYIVVGTLIIGGVVLVILFRKQDFLSLSVSGEPDANRAMFKNPGMRIAVIGGIVMISAYEVMVLVSCISQDMGAGVLLRLVPWALAIVMIILVSKMVGKPRIKQEAASQIPPAVPAPEEPEQGQFNP
ncbi:MAG: CPBP family intramembrane metalloprotease [Lachnospiraceae bacterium]|nr:CPBP family intramembrane metalloprotease [Lachnospiraceae bacterium]